jgi:hypothetical protein
MLWLPECYVDWCNVHNNYKGGSDSEIDRITLNIRTQGTAATLRTTFGPSCERSWLWPRRSSHGMRGRPS